MPTWDRELQPEHRPLYEDLGLLDGRIQSLVADLSDLFNLLTGYSRQRGYRRLLVAPTDLKPPRLIELIPRGGRGAGSSPSC